MNYYYYYRQDAACVLRHVRRILSSFEEEMAPQIKFPTSKNVLKDPLVQV